MASDAVKDLVSAGLDQAIDMVDKSSEGAIGVINQARGAVHDVAGAGVKLSDTLSEDTIEEIQSLRQQLIARLRAAKEEALKPLEVLP